MTTVSQPIATSKWVLDASHSIAEFSVKHMMVSTVKGRFRTVAGTLHIDEANPENSWVEASIDVASIDTAEAQRDEHLRSDDFFNAEKFPLITFRSSNVESVGGSEWKIYGDLTIRDVTRPVVLQTEYEGRVTDPWGNERLGFTAETSISRKDYGLKWNALLETGGAVVGDKVRISLHIEAVKQA